MIIFNQVSENKKNRLFDYKDSNGVNVMQLWAINMSMQKRDRGRLDFKIDLLERAGDNLPPKLVHPTTCKHIMHLVVNGEVSLRPMFCRGPVNNQDEYTFLFGTIEKDIRFVQRDAPERAEQNRKDLKSNPKNRCIHERFGKDQTNIQR